MSFNSFPMDNLYQPLGPSDQRLSSVWTKWNPEMEPSEDRQFHLAGYPDDQGIINNGGRPGSSQAPERIRNFLSRMTPPAFVDHPVEIIDHGNIDTKLKLDDQQKFIEAEVVQSLELGARWIGIGGGHDYGFPDAAGFLNYCSQQENPQRPLVVNFDAHLDVRSDKNGISSGTPFYRLLERFGQEFDFVEVGIQPQCNSMEHYQYVKEKGGHIIWWDEILYSGGLSHTVLCERLSSFCIQPRPLFISVDIDAFSNAYAMGCSQSWSTGLTPEIFFPAFKFLNERCNALGLGVYEVSPPLDSDDITSKLASQIIYNFIYAKL